MVDGYISIVEYTQLDQPLSDSGPLGYPDDYIDLERILTEQERSVLAELY